MEPWSRPLLVLLWSWLGHCAWPSDKYLRARIVVRGKGEIPRQVLGITVRLKMSRPDCRKSQGSRPKVEKYKRTFAAKIDVTPAVKTVAVCEANPGKWQTNLTVSSNLICNLRRCLETFLLSAQLFPSPDSDSEYAVFSFLHAQTDWLGVNVRLTMLHPYCFTAVQELLEGNYSDSAALVTHFQLWQWKREMRCDKMSTGSKGNWV